MKHLYTRFYRSNLRVSRDRFSLSQQSVIHFITNTRSRLLRQVSEQVQRIVHTARMAGMGRSHNEFTVLQLQREHEREEDKARVRVQQGLLPGPDSERQRDFSTPK